MEKSETARRSKVALDRRGVAFLVVGEMIIKTVQGFYHARPHQNLQIRILSVPSIRKEGECVNDPGGLSHCTPGEIPNETIPFVYSSSSPRNGEMPAGLNPEKDDPPTAYSPHPRGGVWTTLVSVTCLSGHAMPTCCRLVPTPTVWISYRMPVGSVSRHVRTSGLTETKLLSSEGVRSSMGRVTGGMLSGAGVLSTGVGKSWISTVFHTYTVSVC